MTESVLAELAALKTKSTPELRAQWEGLFDRPAPPYGRKMLEARIGYRLQELRFGGLSERARRKLDALAEQLEPKGARRRNAGRPIAGTQLIRQWAATEHVVTVRQDDFEYNGRSYKSLSAIARTITGTRWNGPLFFGLRQNGKPSELSDAQV
jgi:Protein of unknown function (DUF2924)